MRRLIRPSPMGFGLGIAHRPLWNCRADETYSGPADRDQCTTTQTPCLGTLPPDGVPGNGRGTVVTQSPPGMMATWVGICSGASACLPAPRVPRSLPRVSPALAMPVLKGLDSATALLAVSDSTARSPPVPMASRGNPWFGPWPCRQGLRERSACRPERGLLQSEPGGTTPAACSPTTQSGAGVGTTTAKRRHRLNDSSPSVPEANTPAACGSTAPSSAGGGTMMVRQHRRADGLSPSVPGNPTPAACGLTAPSSAGDGTMMVRRHCRADDLSPSVPGHSTPAACGLTAPPSAGDGTTTAKRGRRQEGSLPSVPAVNIPAAYRPKARSCVGVRTGPAG